MEGHRGRMNLISTIITLLLVIEKASSEATATGTYIPLAYQVSKTPECLYERISSSSEHLTGSIFVLDGSELKALLTIDGPVAPVSIDLEAEEKFSGAELQKAIDRYEKEGDKLFNNGKESIQFAEIIDFEHEMMYDDDAPEGGFSGEDIHEMEMEQEERERRLEMQKREETVGRRDARREHALVEEIDKEFEYDDDFVKLQMEEGGRKTGRHKDSRRLSEEILVAGEPYQKTFLVTSPGWYRLCVRAKSDTIEVEMELRKSSTYGEVNPKTGHVPSLEDLEIHSEIRNLFGKEDDAVVLAEEESIKDEDFQTTHEQLRVLERVYHDIIDKQLEERRTWGWRTVHNKHLYSHMVMGNMVETLTFMIVTGWQVYTIRKWFSGGPALGQ